MTSEIPLTYQVYVAPIIAMAGKDLPPGQSRATYERAEAHRDQRPPLVPALTTILAAGPESPRRRRRPSCSWHIALRWLYSVPERASWQVNGPGEAGGFRATRRTAPDCGFSALRGRQLQIRRPLGHAFVDYARATGSAIG